MAINSSAAAEFKTVEQGCDAQLPACGCASFGTSAEDGTLVSNPSTIVVACTNHTCESYYRGSTFDRSGSVCTDQQYCIIWSRGTASRPKGTCSSFVENCNDCGCTGAGVCACAIQDGHAIVHCQAT